MNKLITATTLIILSASTAFADNNSLTIEQVASSMDSDIEVEQRGSNNEAFLGQGQGQINNMLVEQDGDTNIIRAEQWDANGSSLEIRQSEFSGGNLIEAEQSGAENKAVLFQEGYENSITMRQGGQFNTTYVDQWGQLDHANITQNGVGGIITVQQH